MNMKEKIAEWKEFIAAPANKSCVLNTSMYTDAMQFAEEAIEVIEWLSNAPVFDFECYVEDHGVVDGQTRCGSKRAAEFLKKWGK